jgi:predicted TIM-barrel fold metal-dependent hydrolase
MTKYAPPAFRVPEGACDCHTHVFGSREAYPLSPHRRYTPGRASVRDIAALQERLGLSRVVLVQPSPYGTDNSCLLDALGELNGRGRGVVVIDGAASDDTLAAMHKAGVRGARLNLESTGASDPSSVLDQIRATAARVERFGWHLQAFTNLALVKALRGPLGSLPVPFVLDHFGHAQAERGVAQDGFDDLLDLVSRGKVHVKLSAPYRISTAPGFRDVAPLAQAIVSANADMVLWGSDWPHTRASKPIDRGGDRIDAFQAQDDRALLGLAGQWAPSEAVRQKLLVENPRHLYEF